MTCHQRPVGSPESSDLRGVSFVSADSNLQSGPIMSSPVSFSIIFQVRDRLLQLPHPPVRLHYAQDIIIFSEDLKDDFESQHVTSLMLGPPQKCHYEYQFGKEGFYKKLKCQPTLDE